MLERGEPGDVLVPDLVALGAQLDDSGVDVQGRPEDHGVQDQPERAELVLHPVPVRLMYGASLAVAHVAGKLVPRLLHGQLPVHLPAVGVVDRVDDPQQVLGLDHPPYSASACPSGVGCPSQPNIRSRSQARTWLVTREPATLSMSWQNRRPGYRDASASRTPGPVNQSEWCQFLVT